MFAQVVVHTITCYGYKTSYVFVVCFSDAVKMSYNFKYICRVCIQILTCVSQKNTKIYALFHIGYKLSLFFGELSAGASLLQSHAVLAEVFSYYLTPYLTPHNNFVIAFASCC